ncbi:AAA domain-containing protein [Kribbella sp. NBC_01245]|uniref:AAA domain-containing protein n=1 Tax=Kribbella sp. NBC_01245 TaxID=2903578 RepID=UPI002E28CF95|nr:AAA domain-containing protein [Kribbella sp. NBC_01245]
MRNPRREAILVRNARTGRFDDKTLEVVSYAQRADGRIEIVFTSSSRPYPYGPERVRILGQPEHVTLGQGQQIEVDGVIWENATEVCTFPGDDGSWSRVFYTTTERGEAHSMRPASQVRIISNVANNPAAADILGYWRDIVSRLPTGDSLRSVYDSLDFVHPESALGRYLEGSPIEARELGTAPIYPFRCNLSQRQAVENALTHSISVIEGPPGTGKTETILNLIANIITTGSATVGVVSFGNSAVDNVRDKLEALGFGHVVARLGNVDMVNDFFARQPHRNAELKEFVNQTPPEPPAERLVELDRRLRGLQEAERDRARLRQEVDAYSLELRHFEKHVAPGDLSQLDRLPLLRRSSDRILDYLAESELEAGRRRGLVRRIRTYFKYGSLRGLDPSETAVVLSLQRAFYDQRIAELTSRLAQLDDELSRADFAGLLDEHSRLSVQALYAALGVRYQGLESRIFTARDYRQNFTRFAADYPVLLSTCHSLRRNLPSGQLLDYLIIDEASQVSLLAAGAALASCRNLVVVGDLKQLPHIADGDAARDAIAPQPAYDYEAHSILSSLNALYQQDLPSTLLREHYRCDPAIIGFCNKSFYDGRLVPFTRSEGEQPMIVWRTAEGNHMRRHQSGGRSNQREVDVIVNEVIPQNCAAIPRSDIGITTPYRRQADHVSQAFITEIDKIDANTVHKYQGRQKDVVIMTTVLDETWPGQTGLKFVDDPQLINVAVSRAVKKFILVTNHDKLSKSRYIRDLIDYIGYHDVDGGVLDSQVVSMFDLLYREYSERLKPLAARLRNELKYRSEDIAWTVLHDILAEEQYQHLTVSSQVLVRNLLADVERLTSRQATYVGNRASVDFVVYNRVSNRPLLAIEVDGFAYHENNPAQLERDALKNAIFQTYGLPLLRLPTTGSGEEQRIRAELDRAETYRTESPTR